MKVLLTEKEICEAIAYAAARKGINRGKSVKEVRLFVRVENGKQTIFAEIEEKEQEHW